MIVHLEKRIFADSLSFDAIKELKGLRLHIFVSKRLIHKLSKFCNKMSAVHQMFSLNILMTLGNPFESILAFSKVEVLNLLLV